MNRALEWTRWLCVSLGVFLAFWHQGNPQKAFSLLTLLVVLGLAGLTALESLFFSKGARERSGYQGGGAYQRQSGFNNLATVAACLVVYAAGWGTQAKAAVMCVLLFFLAFSALNHAWSALREGNRSLQNLLRPALTAVLWAFVIPFMLAAL